MITDNKAGSKVHQFGACNINLPTVDKIILGTNVPGSRKKRPTERISILKIWQ